MTLDRRLASLWWTGTGLIPKSHQLLHPYFAIFPHYDCRCSGFQDQWAFLVIPVGMRGHTTCWNFRCKFSYSVRQWLRKTDFPSWWVICPCVLLYICASLYVNESFTFMNPRIHTSCFHEAINQKTWSNGPVTKSSPWTLRIPTGAVSSYPKTPLPIQLSSCGLGNQ